MLDLKLLGIIALTLGAIALMLGADSVGQTVHAPVYAEPQTPSEPPIVRFGAPAISCELVALMPNAPVTAVECQALLDLSRMVAMANPDASREGDEQMNCSDIRAELSHMRRRSGQLAVRLDHSIVAAAQELSESMHANPRLWRLVQLGAAKKCTARKRAT